MLSEKLSTSRACIQRMPLAWCMLFTRRDCLLRQQHEKDEHRNPRGLSAELARCTLIIRGGLAAQAE